MGFEPQKFFIGLVDFFSILMPGALVTYLGRIWVSETPGQRVNLQLDRPEAWVVFLFLSYLLGHFVFLIGAILDDVIYDPIRKATYWGQITRLSQGKRLYPRIVRRAAASRWLFGAGADTAVTHVQRLKARSLHGVAPENAINAYQWSKIRLSKLHGKGLVSVQRFEADSKFFRSLTVVLAVLVPILLVKGRPLLGVATLGFLALALWRYIEQRFKATQQAYWFAMVLDTANGETRPKYTRAKRPDGLTHAGGVVFRTEGDAVRYLLVRASQGRAEWVLPKGHVETGESIRQTAVREVKEESGCWARVVKHLDDVRWNAAEPTVVRFFLMEAEGASADDGSSSEGRARHWLPLPDAIREATYPETKNLLERAEASRKPTNVAVV